MLAVYSHFMKEADKTASTKINDILSAAETKDDFTAMYDLGDDFALEQRRLHRFPR